MNYEQKATGIAAGLITANILIMAAISQTPLAAIMDYVFSYLILGVLFFGVLLTGGVWIARKGLKRGERGMAWAGVGILQFAYGLFGGGILAWLSPGVIPVVTAITLGITLGITLLATVLVYYTNHDFSKWGMYSTYLFLGVVLVALVGTFQPVLAAIAFILALAGFITYLIHEIFIVKQRKASPELSGLGIYVAFMGVFVQILQIVARQYLRR